MGWIVPLAVVVVGLIVWLARLDSRATSNSRDLDRDRAAHEKSHKEIDERIGLTNTRVSLAETQIAV